ncbi:HTH-type transcriptional regulator gltC [uncultured Roseburia sp.]|uniref:LysR family transcriptional regulator n=1 Tax=Brotonthovivens ammoniilytica TaxID=2981725 RepID=A0ABT2TFI2_9FIRM|nr:LysR family transcriptional regulator [Brotonthovivens ammoniilytica]MCU6760902.1 LysR family transcriptional regulator [Brotonthovivens ammoniilytica]SCI12812.1 HTH-type transcriptional regulator gltC [uncultured Roseburia sp.]
MTIVQIKYFITVVKCASYTKAAEQLFISQPALSRHIKNMEEELNIQLFLRTNNGIRLTPAGSSLYVGMLDLYENYIEMVNKAEKIQKGLDGTLKIGILDQTNVSDFMPMIYQYFQENYPNVDLWFQEGSFNYLVSELYSGRLDLIYTLKFEIERKEGIMYQYVSHSKDHIVMSRFHPLAKKDQVTLDDVKDETFVLISEEDNPESAPLILALCKEHGFVPQVHYAKSLAEQILWIAVGMGVSILDSRTYLKLNPDVKFFEIDSNWDPSLVIAWNQNNYNPLLSVFIKKMNEILGTEEEDIHGAGLEKDRP